MENFKTDFEKTLKESNLSEKEIAFKNLNAKEFSKQGFPNRKDEDWKFSDINQIIKKEIGELKFYTGQLKETDIDGDVLLKEIKHNKDQHNEHKLMLKKIKNPIWNKFNY